MQESWEQSSGAALAGGLGRSGDLPRPGISGHTPWLCAKTEARACRGARGPAGTSKRLGICLHGNGDRPLIGAGIGSATLLLIGFAASFAAKLADTFGSEIGKRWGKTTF